MKHLMWMLFILVVLMIGQNFYIIEQKRKGEAIANFLYHNHNKMIVEPDDARHFQVHVTTFDIQIEDMEVFTTINNNGPDRGDK